MTSDTRDPYLDALRAAALLVVVLGHWVATLPRFDEGTLVATDHLLQEWGNAGFLTWLVQVVPLFVFVSAAVAAHGVEDRLAKPGTQRHWWAGRALRLARPTVTYLAVLAALALVSLLAGGRTLEPFNQSLTIHLWFLLMFLFTQALLPLSLKADRQFGLGAVVGLLVFAALVDLARAFPIGAADMAELGERVTASGNGIGWFNAIAVWLLPQQLGIAWRKGRFDGAWTGLALLLLGLAWLLGTFALGYPAAMVGMDFEGRSNMLPPTLALIGVIWLQVGMVLLLARPARALFDRFELGKAVALVAAMGMPLYLWHKLAELPAAWLGAWLQLPIDAGLPGDPSFWTGRLWWLGLCLLMVAPVIAAVLAFELRRRRDLDAVRETRDVVGGGVVLAAGIAVALALGAWPGALLGVFGVAAASWWLRARTS